MSIPVISLVIPNSINYSTLGNKTNCDIHYRKYNAFIPTNMYFVRMSNYPANINWAINMNRATKKISDMMQNNIDIEQIISEAEQAVQNIYLSKSQFAMSYGVRSKHRGGCFDLLSAKNSRGCEYYNKYVNAIKNNRNGIFYTPKSNEQYYNAITCKITQNPSSFSIFSGGNNPYNIKTNLDLVAKAYNNLKKKHAPSKKEIVETAATMQWLIAQETPYLRGSDSVANLLTRSLMLSYGLKISPLKAGVSCDFEAFYRNLDDYINIYPCLFEKNPLLS